MVHGKDIIIMIDGVAIAACKSNDLSISTDTIEIASPTSGTDKEYIAGRSSWTASSNTLVTNVPYLLSMKGKVVDVVIKSPGQINMSLQVTNRSYSGKAIIKSIQITASRNNFATGSIQLQGTGPLTLCSNYSLTNDTTFTIFCPFYRDETEQTFNDSVTCYKPMYFMNGYYQIALICDADFSDPFGNLVPAHIKSISAVNYDLQFSNELNAYVINTENVNDELRYYITWEFDGYEGYALSQVSAYFIYA